MFFATATFSMPFTPGTSQKNTDQVTRSQPQTQQTQQPQQQQQPEQPVSNGVPTEMALTSSLGATIFGVKLTHTFTKHKYFRLGKEQGKKEGVNLYDEWQSNLAACFRQKV